MSKPSAGFTLLELLVALFVFGVIALEIGQGIDFGLRASRVQAGMLDRWSGFGGVDRTLRHLILHMDPGSRTAPPQLEGNATSFRFTSELPSRDPGQASRHADIALLVDGPRGLVLRSTPHIHSGTAAPAQPTQDVLLPGLAALRLSYLYPPGAPAQGWTDRWTERYLPRLVRIHLQFPDGDSRQWPDIVAGPAQDRPHE